VVRRVSFDCRAELSLDIRCRCVGRTVAFIHGWVPLVANGKLVAWAQIGRGLEFLRFSLVAGGRAEASPDAADWLDSERVSARIADSAGTSDFLAPPVLTYDHDPSRLFWAAEVRTPDWRSQRLVRGQH
jgi:hypothetical protein